MLETGGRIKLNPKVTSTELHGNGTWLVVKADDVGIQTECNLYSCRTGSFAEVGFRGINRQFVEDLRNKLSELLITWKISS